MIESKRRHVANPVVQHGGIVKIKYAAIANDLVRDKKITSDAYRVLSLFLSHTDGREESVQAIAERYGWHRRRVRNAFDNLETEHRLIIQEHLTVNGERAFEKYHVHRASRKFTDDEVVKFGKTVVLGGPDVVQSGPGGCTSVAHGDGPKWPTTEEKREDQVEEKEDATSAAVDIKAQKKKIRPEVCRLIDSLVPASFSCDRTYVANIAVKAIIERNTSMERVHIALERWVADGDTNPLTLCDRIKNALPPCCETARTYAFQQCESGHSLY